MCGLRAFLRQGLTKLIPISFARSSAGLPVYVASPQSAPFIVELANPNHFFGGSSRMNDHETSAVWPLS